MRKVLTTFGVGVESAAALKISLPLMAEYAARHGYDLFVPGESVVATLCRGRPPSWGKVGLIAELLVSWPYPDAVVWLDADVVPVRMDRDIVEDAGPDGLSLVVQNTVDGAVPSCGVIVAKNKTAVLDILADAGSTDRCPAGPDGMGLARSHGWWEQAAIIKALGGDPDPTPIVTPPPSGMWSELPYEWNPHPCDPRGIPDDLRFFHGTATNDRLGDMRRWASRVQR